MMGVGVSQEPESAFFEVPAAFDEPVGVSLPERCRADPAEVTIFAADACQGGRGPGKVVCAPQSGSPGGVRGGRRRDDVNDSFLSPDDRNESFTSSSEPAVEHPSSDRPCPGHADQLAELTRPKP